MVLPGISELIKPLAHYVVRWPIRVRGVGLLSTGSLIVWQAGTFYSYSVSLQYYNGNGHLMRDEKLVEIRLSQRQIAALVAVTPPGKGGR